MVPSADSTRSSAVQAFRKLTADIGFGPAVFGDPYASKIQWHRCRRGIKISYKTRSYNLLTLAYLFKKAFRRANIPTCAGGICRETESIYVYGMS